jgi:hypothetical protein
MKGLTLEQVKAARFTRDYDAVRGVTVPDPVISSSRFIAT